MSVATSTAIGIAGAIGAAGAIGGSAISAGAAGHAADTQAAAADQAANLQFQLGQQNLAFQKQQYANSLGLLEPYYATGTQSLGTLAQLMGLNPTPGNTSVFQNPFGQGPAGGPNIPNPFAGGVNPRNFDFGGDGGPRVRMNAEGANLAIPGDTGGASPIFGPGGKPNLGIGPDANLGTLPTDTGGVIRENGTPGQLSVGGNVPGTTAPPGFLGQTFDQTFTPPDAITEQNDPGFQARLKLGQEMLENSAASRGGLLSGGTAKAEQQFGQDYASNEYGNVYNRALQNYNTAFNTFNVNRSNLFNRYASLAGIGQTSAQQLSNAGLATGSNVGNDLLSTGFGISNQLNNAAAARASGYVGAGNAISGGLSGLSNLALLYSIMNKGGGGGGGGGSNLIFADPNNLGATAG